MGNESVVLFDCIEDLVYIEYFMILFGNQTYDRMSKCKNPRIYSNQMRKGKGRNY